MDYQKILEVCEKATPGPWIRRDEEYWMVATSEDAEFIVLARTALPELVKRCMQLEEKWHEFIVEETDHQEKACVAECHNQKHGYCYNMRKCEELESENIYLRKVAEAAKEALSDYEEHITNKPQLIALADALADLEKGASE